MNTKIQKLIENMKIYAPFLKHQLKSHTRNASFVLILIFLLYTLHSYHLNKKEVTESKKILLDNQIILEIIEKSKKSTMTVKEVQDKIEKMKQTLIQEEKKIECYDSQIKRNREGKEITSDYCDKPREEAIKKKPITLDIPKTGKSKFMDFEPEKRFLFACKEMESSNPEKCATVGQITHFFESSNGTSRFCQDQNNCYGIKEPTDKKGLKGKWSVQNGHITFSTEEAGDIAFAYYYSKYHIGKDFESYIRSWVGYYHGPYIEFLEDNYFQLYEKYKNF